MKHMQKLLIVVLLVAFLLAGCGPKEPANQLEAIKEAGKMVVGTSADYPPFEYVDEDGNITGFDIDLINEMGKKMGVDVEVVDMPFDSLIAAVQEGKIDLSIAAFNYSAERDEKVDYTDFYYTAEDCFLVAEGFAGEIGSADDLADYVIGAQQGTTEDDWLTSNVVEAGIVAEDDYFRYDRVDQGAMDVKSGRVDVFMADYIPGVALAEQVGGLVVLKPDWLEPEPMGIIIPDGTSELQAELNKVIKELQDEGVVNDIAVEYFSE